MTRRTRARVIGIGNRWRGDDAAGLLAARRVRELASEEIEVTELEGEPIRMLDAFEEAGTVIVLDAVSSGSEPGTLHRVDAQAERLPARLGGPSTHALGLAETIELGRSLGSLPQRLVVYGIEGARFHMSDRVSPAVADAVEEAAAAAIGEVQGPALRSSRGSS